jgi:hypothetical protein
MIIDDLDIDGTGGTFRPFEANPPLVIDADAVLAVPVAPERFEPIAGQSGKVFQARCGFEPVESEFGLSPETLPNVLTIGKTFGFSVPVFDDHRNNLAVITLYVKHIYAVLLQADPGTPVVPARPAGSKYMSTSACAYRRAGR